MITKEQFKKYFWFIFGILGIVFFWTGVWDGLGNLSYLKHPLVSLFVGIVMLTCAGFIFKEASPFATEIKEIEKVMGKIQNHPAKHEFDIIYHDKLKQKTFTLKAHNLQTIEKGFLIFSDVGKPEVFVPLHRIREVLHKGQTHWKANGS